MIATNRLGDLGLGSIHMNMSLINWYSKKQSIKETSVFGTEFVLIKVGMETLNAIQYKLRMMGIPISGASHIYGDDMLVIHNISKPESPFKKKCNQLLIMSLASLGRWENY